MCAGLRAVSTDACETCGNGVVDEGESCDGDDLDGATCSDFVVMGVGSRDVRRLVRATSSTIARAWSPCGTARRSSPSSWSRPLVDPNFFEGEWIEVHNPHPDRALRPPGLPDPGPRGGGVVHRANQRAHATGRLRHVRPRYTPGELGFVPDYSVPNNFALVNSGDTVRINCGGTIFDQVVYDDQKPWPGVETGIAIATESDVLSADANDDGAAWCLAPNEYAPGMTGTPGAPNDC